MDREEKDVILQESRVSFFFFTEEETVAAERVGEERRKEEGKKKKRNKDTESGKICVYVCVRMSVCVVVNTVRNSFTQMLDDAQKKKDLM